MHRAAHLRFPEPVHRGPAAGRPEMPIQRAHRALERARAAGPRAVVTLMLTGTAYERLMSRYLTRAERNLLQLELRARDRALRALARVAEAGARELGADAELVALALALLADADLAARTTEDELAAALRIDRAEFGPVARALESATTLRAAHVLASLAVHRRRKTISAG